MKGRQQTSKDRIRLRGVRQHNLKGIDLDIPLNRLIAVSGVSGSGKSSLALHTLYAEGQRRYVETFSPYARQFLERMDPPHADLIEGIPPSVAIESGTAVRSSRSTVGTITEINDHLKLLYARLAVPHCPQCGRPVTQDTPESVLQKLQALPPGSRVLVTFPIRPPEAHIENWIQSLIARGFLRFFHQDRAMELEALPEFVHVGGANRDVLIVVDRIRWGGPPRERIVDSLSTAFEAGNGQCAVVVLQREVRRFSRSLSCADCESAEPIPQPTPNLFSFNSPVGACPACRGFGRTIGVDLDLVIPDRRLSLRDGAVKPWGIDRDEYQDLMAFCRRESIPVDVPFENLKDQDRNKIIEGTDSYYGVKGFFEWLETKTYKMHVRVFLSRYRAYTPCGVCGGTRFRKATGLFRLRGMSLGELSRVSVERLCEFFSRDWPESSNDPAAALLLDEIRSRLQFLRAVGLEYLTLDRQSRTLSGGEVQRVHLTRALGSALVNVLYVLDEPSVGLHARDQKRLMSQLRRLAETGNTVVVVEHDPDMIRFCDEVVDMGPGGGERGGEVLYQGRPEGLAGCDASLTGRYLREGGRGIQGRGRKPDRSRILTVQGARENNLKDVTVDFPLGLLIGVSGVSGSGKSTLVEKTLHCNWLRFRGLPTDSPGVCRGLDGTRWIREMLLVDQQPVGRSPRANLLTYTGALNPIRKMLAATPEAIARGYSIRHFSFNVPGGRCEVCNGEGYEQVEMQFLADVNIRCPRCDGRRFKDEVLEIRVKGLSIGDMLDCTAQELLDRYGDYPALVNTLRPVVEMGLDYLRVGQPLNTLSGGEAQRLKLLRYLGSSAGVARSAENGATRVFLLDEPTTGLHPHDLKKLLDVLQKLVDLGNTVIVVEHNLELLAACDWLIDLGPEGGEGGGDIVAAGPPHVVAEHPGSHTGRFLRERRSQQVAAGTIGEAAGKGGFSFGGTRHGHHDGFAEAAESTGNDLGPSGAITIRGAREHNLQLAEITLPRERMTVLTGLSGSGKSTLAFDVLFAEGQRRYMECLSAYVRQYFKILEKPDVDQIHGLPPTVAIEQRISRLNRRSTVGTITEIYHFLRLAYAKLGRQHCPQCGQELSALTFDQILSLVDQEIRKGNRRLLAPLVRGRKGIYRDLFVKLLKMGFHTVRVDGGWLPLDPLPVLERHREHDIELLVADLESSHSAQGGVAPELLRRALSLGGGSVHVPGKEERILSQHLHCHECQQGFAPLDPRLFSFNSRHGACPACEGIGTESRLNVDCLVGPTEEPLRHSLFRFSGAPHWRGWLKGALKRMEEYWIQGLGVTPDLAFDALKPDVRETILRGRAGSVKGLIPLLEGLQEDDGNWSEVRQLFRDEPCPLCNGQRLNAQARAVRMKGWTIGELVHQNMGDFERIWKGLKFEPRETPIAHPIWKEIAERIRFLREVGLDYLALDRAGDTLSGGETQRIRLAAQLGSNLRGVCYILDEPTIGLHPTDNERLLESLDKLKAKGNTIVVVEHDAETMRRSDTLIELGPGAGKDGGRIVAQGTFRDLCRDPATLTRAWFGSSTKATFRESQHPSLDEPSWLEVEGARARNLKGIHVRIPLGALTCVTGVSGAGKSTLVNEVVGEGIKERLGKRYRGCGVQLAGMKGHESIRRILEVDHNPIGRTPRSIPATYVGVWDEIRKLFALLPEARARGYSAGRFSFNVKGGRCEACKGQGEVRVEMHFLPDVFVPCETCGGRRYNDETLAVQFKGMSIADVLGMTIEEGVRLFEAFPKIRGQLEILKDLGLGYLTLGQPSPSLSGGEAQRIKLAGEVGNHRIRTLYILDEPTTGLHRADVKRLLDVLHALTANGHTVIVVEHNLDFIWASDWIIDLGPGSGDRGGRVVAEGKPREILDRLKQSATARALRKHLQEGGLGET